MRLEKLPGVVAVETVDAAANPEIAGYIFVRMHAAPCDIRPLHAPPPKGDDDADMERDEQAKILLDCPEALPGAVRVFWVDAGGAIADHLRDDMDAINTCINRLNRGGADKLKERIQEMFGSTAARGAQEPS